MCAYLSSILFGILHMLLIVGDHLSLIGGSNV